MGQDPRSTDRYQLACTDYAPSGVDATLCPAASIQVSRMGDSIPGQQSEQESKQIMTMKSISTASAMLITLSL